jgi:hypothetical protein
MAKFFDHCNTLPRKLALASGRTLNVSQVVITKEGKSNAVFSDFRGKESLHKIKVALNHNIAPFQIG